MRKINYIAPVVAGVILLAGMSLVPVQASYIIQSAYSLFQDEGIAVTRRATANFVGGGVTVTDTGTVTQISIPGAGTNYSQSFTNQTSVVLTDNLGTTNKIVQCYSEASPAVWIEPDSITLTDANNTTVTFSVAQSGTCVVNGFAAASNAGQVFTVSTTLTSSQLLNIASSPVVLVAAPGVGKVILPLAGMFFMTVGTQYVNTGTGTMNLGYGTSTLAACGSASNLNAYVTSATSVAGICTPNVLGTPVANAALQFNKLGNSFTVGTGSMFFTLTYTVVASQ